MWRGGLRDALRAWLRRGHRAVDLARGGTDDWLALLTLRPLPRPADPPLAGLSISRSCLWLPPRRAGLDLAGGTLSSPAPSLRLRGRSPAWG